MANNFDSNTVEDLANVFIDKFESARCVTKTVDSQIIQGRFKPRTGGEVSVKRPHDYNAIETPRGDISGSTKNDIIAGKATATVQNMITVAVEWDQVEEALEMDQMEQLIAPMATRAVTKMETNLASYMRRNGGLMSGTPGTPVIDWEDVSYAGAFMDAIGVPMDSEIYYLMNPFVATKLAGAQTGLTAADGLVRTAWEKAQISDNFGGMRVMTCNTLSTIADDATLADRVGALSATPDGTYLAAKDTMVQSWPVSGFTANAVIKAGSVVEVTDRFYLNMSTREAFMDETGAKVKFRGVVTADVTLDGLGAGTLVVTGPALNEVNGQYNTVDSALTSGDVVTVLGTAGYTSQPNLFYHRQAFGMATIDLPKLFSTDTIIETEDGFSIRVSKYSDGDTGVQKVRFDLHPAFITYNPFFGGQSAGR
jgi:hypothetical protein